MTEIRYRDGRAYVVENEALQVIVTVEGGHIAQILGKAAGGKLIFISSVHDIIPWEGHANYAAAKGGLMLFLKSLAQEVAHLRIRVNAISPGAIRTPMNVDKLTSPEIYEQVLLKLIPTKRIGEPEDIAQVAVWLASDQSDYVNGTTIYIDGGMTLDPEFIGAG